MFRKLFLLGGSPAYDIAASDFVAAAGEQVAIAALVQTNAGWQEHGVEITQPWQQRGVSRIMPVAPEDDGNLNIENATRILQQATGIFIGGGHTPTYHRLFVLPPLGPIIQQRYWQGVPVAGVSAGALVALEICPLTSDETGGDCLAIVPGLELARGFVIGVHFTERNALPEVLEVMAQTRTPIGYGIDEPACIVCENGRLTRTLGKSVHQIEMLDFDTRSYHVSRCEA